MTVINNNTCPNCRRSLTTPQDLDRHLKHGCDLDSNKNITLGVQKMTNEEKNRKVCLILGIHWHEIKLNIDGINYRCSCGSLLYSDLAYNHVTNLNPDFCDDAAGAVRLLRELELRKTDYYDFLSWITYLRPIRPEEQMANCITTPVMLLDKLIEWKEEKG